MNENHDFRGTRHDVRSAWQIAAMEAEAVAESMNNLTNDPFRFRVT